MGGKPRITLVSPIVIPVRKGASALPSFDPARIFDPARPVKVTRIGDVTILEQSVTRVVQ